MKKRVGIILAERETNNAFWDLVYDWREENTLKKDGFFKENRPKDYVLRPTFDTAKVHFFVQGVNHLNRSEYSYRVTEGANKTVVPWTAITKLNDTLMESPEKGYLGGYAATPNHYLVVDLKKKGDDKIISTAVAFWEEIRPNLKTIYTGNELNDFLRKLREPWRDDAKNHRLSAYLLPQDPLNPGIFKFDANENTLIFYFDSKVDRKDQIQYEVIRDGKIYRDWRENDYDNTFVWLKDLPSGNYVLKVRFTVQPQNITECKFLIKPAWYEAGGFRIVIIILSLVFAGLVVLATLYIKQKRKAKRELVNKTKLQLGLKSIQAQLNPHFIFNALSSIQGLINKKDIDGANHYLTVFGTLMRDSLKDNNKDQTNLKQEIKTLETYLALEQLRFGFKYKVAVDPEINVFETEVPTLMLQPLLENSVKHGVALLNDKGLITLSFKRTKDDMVASVTDNGQGFNADSAPTGYGLKLTRDRIKLLNQMMPDTTITMNVQSKAATGTTIYLTFSNWFL